VKKSLIVILVIIFILSAAGTVAAAPGAFSDVPVNHWSYGAVTKLAQAGVITGDQREFMGDRIMTRYEMAQIVARAMEHYDAADANNKILIDKLSAEYDAELKGLDVKFRALETKVNKTKISGEFDLVYLKYDDKINNGIDKDKFFRTQAIINFQQQVTDSASFYARFATRSTFGGTYGQAANGQTGVGSTNGYQSLDQYGVKYSLGDWRVNIGRQAVFLGQGLLLSTGNNVQWDDKFDGLVASTKAGSVDITAIMGKTTLNEIVLNSVPATWYALDLKGKVSDSVSLGASFARAQDDQILSTNNKALALYNQPNGINYNPPGTNYWAMNTTIKATSNFTVTGEYGKSSASDRNKAYVIGGNLALGRDSFTAQYMHVEGNAIEFNNSLYSRAGLAIWGAGTWFNNNGNTDLEGWMLIYSHPLSKEASLVFFDEILKNPGYSGKNNEGSITFAFKF
jgi:hypothetical protein